MEDDVGDGIEGTRRQALGRRDEVAGGVVDEQIQGSLDTVGEGVQPLRARAQRHVDEEQRAWHAGKSYWRGVTDVNSASVGIEIVNPGHEFGYRPFPPAQMEALLPLVAAIKDRPGISRGNIVGHSDVAPARKEDPGELFPWEALARRRLVRPRR